MEHGFRVSPDGVSGPVRTAPLAPRVEAYDHAEGQRGGPPWPRSAPAAVGPPYVPSFPRYHIDPPLGATRSGRRAGRVAWHKAIWRRCLMISAASTTPLARLSSGRL